VSPDRTSCTSDVAAPGSAAEVVEGAEGRLAEEELCGNRDWSESWPSQPGNIIVAIAKAATRHPRMSRIVVASSALKHASRTDTGPLSGAQGCSPAFAQVLLERATGIEPA
jgi:hypothetical protein